MSIKRPKIILLIALAVIFSAGRSTALVFAQAQIAPPVDGAARYLDQVGGMTADQAVALALENNGELQAMRKEVDAARAMVKQAGLRPNPTLTASGAQQINGKDNNQMAD